MLDEKFEAIMAAAISDAEGVKCTLEDFINGLETMQIALANRLNEAESEMDNQ